MKLYLRYPKGKLIRPLFNDILLGNLLKHGETLMVMEKQGATTYAGFDFYNCDMHFTDKQKALRQEVRDFVEREVLPKINPYWEKAEFPWEIARKMVDLPIIGGALFDHGAAGLDFVEMGLVMYELGKGDGSISTFYGVHSGLAMGSIGLLGDEEQKARWLPDMVKLEKIGAFGLTEPDVGSNAAQVKTTVRRDGDGYILNGAKRWIGNASIADILIIWARDENTRRFRRLRHRKPERNRRSDHQRYLGQGGQAGGTQCRYQVGRCLRARGEQAGIRQSLPRYGARAGHGALRRRLGSGRRGGGRF